MAVAPTGDVYKSLTFDGKTSRSYGVYITGEAVYNAPEREVEMISIPGRNGAFALDKGRFENVTVTYPAGIFADTEADFRQAISDFRNFLCSKKGYCRLSDDYNPNEYRMAVYKSGLEVDPAQLRAGEFEITFECKPQRWLTSGETKVTIAQSGDTITNPTLFESSPLLEVEGYGTIGFNGHEIEIANADIGTVILADKKINWHEYVFYDKGNLALLQTGDDITLLAGSILYSAIFTKGAKFVSTSTTITSSDVQCHISDEQTVQQNVGWGYFFYITLDEDITVAKESTATFDIEISGTVQYLYDHNTLTYTGTQTLSLEFYETYLKSSSTFWSPALPNFMSQNTFCFSIRKQIIGTSTVAYAGHPLYIDCDFGEAYKIEGGQYASLNEYIDLGSELPTLASGSNAITFDNTVTDLKVTPRWWKV